MGMFDRINFCCPECNKIIEVQSKAGECSLIDYPNSAVPANIAMSINGRVVYCDSCNLAFKIKYERKPDTVKMRLKRV